MEYTIINTSTEEVIENGNIVDELASELIVPQGCRVEWSSPENVGKVQYEHILASIKLSDDSLNGIVQAYIDQEELNITVGQFRVLQYSDLRAVDYPDSKERDDAQAKLFSTDPVIQAEGQAQLDQYYSDCLAVKARFPKQQEASDE
jgi:hypothetical protein